MLPRVIPHNAVSVDGRVDWSTPDVGLSPVADFGVLAVLFVTTAGLNLANG